MQVVALKPSDLSTALQSIVGKNKRSYKKRFSVIMGAKGEKFAVADAQYHATTAEMPCTGDWKGTAEINGPQFRNIMKTFINNELALISKEDDSIIIKSGSSTITLKRLDPLDKKKTKRKPLPHKGKVEHPPDPTTKKAEYNDTWKFSARVPLPADAYKKRIDDKE